MGIETVLENKRLFESLSPEGLEKYEGQIVAVYDSNIRSCAPKDYLHMIRELKGEGVTNDSIFVRYVFKE